MSAGCLAFGQQARDAGIAVSMGSRGDCYDAVAESFFATLKKELVGAAAGRRGAS